jgi:hypothetical protein
VIKICARISKTPCILLRVEVSIFVLSPEIEDRDEIEVANWAPADVSTPRTPFLQRFSTA